MGNTGQGMANCGLIPSNWSRPSVRSTGITFSPGRRPMKRADPRSSAQSRRGCGREAETSPIGRASGRRHRRTGTRGFHLSGAARRDPGNASLRDLKVIGGTRQRNSLARIALGNRVPVSFELIGRKVSSRSARLRRNRSRTGFRADRSLLSRSRPPGAGWIPADRQMGGRHHRMRCSWTSAYPASSCCPSGFPAMPKSIRLSPSARRFGERGQTNWRYSRSPSSEPSNPGRRASSARSPETMAARSSRTPPRSRHGRKRRYRSHSSRR